jgi:hypothetical protein
MNGPFPRCVEVLIAVFADAIAREGDKWVTLELDEKCNDHSDAQWHAFVEHRGSVAFVSWCTDNLNHWRTPEYIARQVQVPVLGVMPALGFMIMSPDSYTDWTLAAWHIHAYVNAKTHNTQTPKPFTERFMHDFERAPTLVCVADIEKMMTQALDVTH